MSKHTVSLNGIDTGKIGNNKRVKLSEEFPDPSKITAQDIEDKYGFENLPTELQTVLGPTGEKIKFDIPKLSLIHI